MNRLQKIYSNIYEYFDNGINPLAAFYLRKSNRVNLFCFWGFYVTILAAMILLLVILPPENKDANIIWGFSLGIGMFFVLIGFAAATVVMTSCDVGYNGDETFRLIPIPYLERWHTGVLLCFVSGLIVLLLTFIAVIIAVLIDFGNISFLLIPPAQLAALWILLLLTTIIQGIAVPFRSNLENFLMFLIVVIPFILLLTGFVYLNHNTLKEMDTRMPAYPLTFFTAAIISVLFLLHLWAAASYLLIRHYLLSPRKGIGEILRTNFMVHTAALLLIFITATVLVWCY
jgi:hypothetical protein